jgi:hypothetical protein
MMQHGSVDDAGEWLDLHSLAQSLEAAMVDAGLLDLSDETADAALQRRKTFVAMSTAIVDYLTAHMDVAVAVGDLRATGESGAQLPATSKTFTVSSGQITIGAGTLRAATDTGVRLPLTAKTLTGRVS